MAFSLIEQLPEHGHHSDRTDTGPHGVVESFLVRFGFVLPTEPREHCAADDIDRRAGGLAVANARENARQGDADVCSLRLLHLLHRVAPDNVSNLMTQNAGELVHLVGALDETAIHVHEAAGHRESVYFLGVDDEELPVEITAARDPRNRVSEDVDVAIDLRVLDDR